MWISSRGISWYNVHIHFLILVSAQLIMCVVSIYMLHSDYQTEVALTVKLVESYQNGATIWRQFLASETCNSKLQNVIIIWKSRMPVSSSNTVYIQTINENKKHCLQRFSRCLPSLHFLDHLCKHFMHPSKCM
jgi:hypothetical protein